MAAGEAGPGADIGVRTERRIGWLTLAIGAVAAAGCLFAGRMAWAGGMAMGAGLAWINFRWLARGLDALVAASIAQGERVSLEEGDSGETARTRKAQVPPGTYFTGIFRYGLIGGCGYAIFVYLHVPLGSLLLGLCALGAAAMAASVYEILRPAG